LIAKVLEARGSLSRETKGGERARRAKIEREVLYWRQCGEKPERSESPGEPIGLALTEKGREANEEARAIWVGRTR
jgi:hypothetical protein